MWEIESGKATVYLLGSIHLANDSLYPLDKRIEEAFDDSDALVVELNINEVNPTDVMKKAYYNDTNLLEYNVSVKTFALFTDSFAKHKIPKYIFNKFKPWFAALMLEQLELKAMGYNEKQGIDKHFLDKAKSKKEIIELETFAEQLALFEELEKNSDDFVKYSFDDLNKSTQNIGKMFSAWKIGNTKVFEELINDASDTIPSMKEITAKFIDKRNVKMSEKIQGFLQKKGVYFVVVGSGHIVGNKGIISLLEQTKKYRIEQY